MVGGGTIPSAAVGNQSLSLVSVGEKIPFKYSLHLSIQWLRERKVVVVMIPHLKRAASRDYLSVFIFVVSTDLKGGYTKRFSIKSVLKGNPTRKVNQWMLSWAIRNMLAEKD